MLNGAETWTSCQIGIAVKQISGGKSPKLAMEVWWHQRIHHENDLKWAQRMVPDCIYLSPWKAVWHIYVVTSGHPAFEHIPSYTFTQRAAASFVANSPDPFCGSDPQASIISVGGTPCWASAWEGSTAMWKDPGLRPAVIGRENCWRTGSNQRILRGAPQLQY